MELKGWREDLTKPRREAKIQFEIARQFKNVIEKHKEIGGLRFKDVDTEYPVDGKKADIVIFEDGRPFLVIETKKKIEEGGRTRSFYDFDPNSEKVIHQAFNYAGILGASYFATTDGKELLIFRFKSPFYRLECLVYHESIEAINESFALRVLSELSKKSGLSLEKAKLPIDWNLIIRFRGFVNYLYPKVKGELFRKVGEDDDFKRKVDEFIKKQGLIAKEDEEEYQKYRDFIAKESVYLLLNKIIFYKILEKQSRYSLSPLKGEEFEDIGSIEKFFLRLKEKFFEKVLSEIDFVPVFSWSIFDEIPYPEDFFILEYLIDFINEVDKYGIEEIRSDIIGHVYEELIPTEERHKLGQYYTPPSIAELIVNWCVRSPWDSILDLGCGSGTFLVKAYNRLLKSKRRDPQTHVDTLSKLYGIDISPFPAHLATINLAMMNIASETNIVNIIPDDFFNVTQGQEKLLPYEIETPRGKVIRGITIPCVDAVVANPPYTRHEEIAEDVKKNIRKGVRDLIERYKISGESGIYIYFILHGFQFLKEDGRLGMIIPDAWMYSNYGKGFKEFLLNNFKVCGVVLFDKRVFKMPLVSTCILLLERAKKGREENKTTLLYLSKETEVERVLDLIDSDISTRDDGIKSVSIEQRELEAKNNWLDYLFLPKICFELKKKLTTLRELENKKLIKIYGGFDLETGANPFFVMNERTVKSYGINKFVIPTITKAQYAPIYDFNEEDWERLKDSDKPSYLFYCHLPSDKIPKNVIEYIKFGKSKGFDNGKIVKAREKSKQHYGWYDIGELEVSDRSIILPMVVHDEPRFVYAPFRIRPIHNLMLISIGKETDNERMLALLAYLNSTLPGLFSETLASPLGGGGLRWDITPLRNLPIIDINSLSQSKIRKLSNSFDKFRGGIRRQYDRWKEKKIITRDEFKSKVKELRMDLLDREVVEILNLSEDNLKEVYETLDMLRGRRLGRLEKADYMITGEEIPTKLEQPEILKKRRKKDTISLFKFMENGQE